MTTLKRLRHIAAALCLAGAPLGTYAADVPAKAAASDPVYAVELRAYLNYIRLYERTMVAMRSRALPAEPLQRELMQGFLASLTADQFYAKAIPVYAKHIPPQHAATLGAMARKRPVPFGAQQAALQAFSAADTAGAPEMVNSGRQLALEYVQGMQEKVFAEVRRSAAELGAHRGTQYTVQIHKVGMPILDSIVSLGVNHLAKQMNASMTAQDECKAAGIGDTLRPANIMAADGIKMAQAAIDACEHALEKMEKSSEAAFRETQEGFMALNLPEKVGLAQRLDGAAQNYYDFILKYGELNRQALQTHRRLVSLFEARRARIHLQDGRLIFETQDDLGEFNRIVQEATTAEQAVNDFVYEARQKTPLQGVDLHDGITAPQAAARTN